MPLLPNWICHPILQMTGVPEIVCPRVTIWGVSYARAVAPLNPYHTVPWPTAESYTPLYPTRHERPHRLSMGQTRNTFEVSMYAIHCMVQHTGHNWLKRHSDVGLKRLHLGFRCRYCGHIRRKDIRTDCQIGPTNFPVQIFWQLGRTNHISFIRAICHLQV